MMNLSWRADRSGSPGRLPYRVLARSACIGALCTGAVLWQSGTAAALPQRGHVFSFSFGSAGGSDGQFQDPSAVAVDQATGDVYVADYENNRVEVFEPQLDAGGQPAGEKYVRSISVPAPTSVAVDGSTESADPSRGDVYVAGSTPHEVKEEEPNKRVFKFSPEGKLIAVIRKFKEPVEKGEEPEEAEELGEVQGLAVDARGDLYVYQPGGVDVYANTAKRNKGLFSLPAPARARRGLAVDSEDDLYVGHESENPEASGPEGPAPVIGKLENVTGALLVEELNTHPSSAVAVNTANVRANQVDEENDVYLASLGERDSTIDAYSPSGALLQSFTAPGLKEASGVAVDDQTGTLYVTDAASDDVDVFALEEPGAPQVEHLTARVSEGASGGTVTLTAQVDPAGAPTSYRFQYGPAACTINPTSCTTTQASAAGEGFNAQQGELELPGLAPGVYHYRVLATNAHGTTEGREQTFTVPEQVSGLPDGRSWEMVSPPDKHGAPIESLPHQGGVIQAAEDGGAITYAANGSISERPQGNRSFEPQQVLSVRTPAGWESQDIATPNTQAAGTNFGAPEYQFFSPDLSVALVEPYGEPAPLAPETPGRTVYLRDDPPLSPEAAERESYALAEANNGFLAPGFTPLLDKLTAPQAPAGASVRFLDATPDLRHAIVSSGSALTGAGSAGGLYEWSQGEAMRFVSVLPDGEPQPSSQLALGYYQVRAHAISDNGSRVIWTASQETPAHLYLRDLSDEKTLQLDAAQEGALEGEGAAKFQTASADAGRVFFTDDQPLLPDARTEPERQISDLYVCEISETGGEPSCVLRDLTIPINRDERADVQGFVLGASEDGSVVYLVAHGVLAENENTNNEVAQPGQDNLYELHYSSGEWASTFIATLSEQDSPDWDEGPNVSDENTSFQTARVSPNGQYLAFMSDRSLTGYDNEDVSSQHPGERLDEEAYLYDSQTASLTCVSCDPTGARPTGVFDQEAGGEGIGLLVDRRESWRGDWISGSIPGWTSESLTNALIQSRYLNNEGRLFFDSSTPLVAGIPQEDQLREENVGGHAAKVGVENVYEYEPAGLGGCPPQAGACVALISSGTSDEESAFLEATASGSEVFLLTAAQLSPQDRDDAFDVYDARECTPQSPCLAPPEPEPASCNSGEQCQLEPEPGHGPLTQGATATFTGQGNLTPTSKGEVKASKTTAPTTSKPLTRAQKLAHAVSACKRRYPHARKHRLACEAHARRLYAPKPAHKSRSSAKRSARRPVKRGAR